MTVDVEDERCVSARGRDLVNAARKLAAERSYKYWNGAPKLGVDYRRESELSCTQFIAASLREAFGLGHPVLCTDQLREFDPVESPAPGDVAPVRVNDFETAAGWIL